MLIRTRKPWMLTDNDVTPEHLYRNRRQIMAAGAAGLASLALPGCARAQDDEDEAASTTVRETVTGEDGIRYVTTDYDPGAPLAPYEAVTQYNNFYEFGTDKSDPARHAHNMTIEPWSIEVGGHCERPGTFGLEDMINYDALEERIYRLRCVEAWSMVIPWIGVPLADVLARYGPTSNAKYVGFETYLNPAEMRGVRRNVLEWPYVEGLRIDEAMHPLTFLAVGVYGESLPKQNGAPVRLVVPWKYGFKSIKSIVRITFTEDQPPTSWGRSQPREYGFYSNVNPNVNHPRWSQASERIIGGGFNERRDTDMFNGFTEEVAHLYEGLDLRANF